MVQRHQQIQKIAYLLWEQHGSPEGQNEYFWHLAVEQYDTENPPAEKAPAKKVKAVEPPTEKPAKKKAPSKAKTKSEALEEPVKPKAVVEAEPAVAAKAAEPAVKPGAAKRKPL